MRYNNKVKKVWILTFLLLIPLAARAGGVSVSLGNLGTSGFEQSEQKQFNLEGVAFNWVMSDLGNDNIDELIVARFGSGGATYISVLRQDGSVISDFAPFPKNNGPVDYCLLNKKIFATTLTYPYELGIFKPAGKKISALKWPVTAPKDIFVACHNNDAVVTVGQKIFYYRANIWTEIKSRDKITGRIKLYSLDLGTDEIPELIASNEKGEAWIWDNNYQYIKKTNLPLAFVNAEPVSVNVAILDNQRVWLIASGAGQDNLTLWRPSVGTQTLPVPDQSGWQIVEQKSTGKIWLLPSRQKNPVYVGENKQIVVNIKNQTLIAYQVGVPIIVTKVSTGIWNLPTPIGDFNILNKKPRAYSKKYNLYMPWWMIFQSQGYGLHELPEWANGYKEGENHLGVRVSHGCIRLGVGPAKALYDWAEVGTKVKVMKE